MRTGFTKGSKHTKKTKIKMRLAHLGKKIPDEVKKKMSISQPKGEKHYLWKGDDAKYCAIHNWLYRRLGKPRYCEHCKDSKLRHRQYQWANVSRTYKRELSDWIRLCVKCHKKYDKNNPRTTK